MRVAGRETGRIGLGCMGIPIPGTKRRTRLEENAAAADLRLTPEDVAELDALPAAVGSRY